MRSTCRLDQPTDNSPAEAPKQPSCVQQCPVQPVLLLAMVAASTHDTPAPTACPVGNCTRSQRLWAAASTQALPAICVFGTCSVWRAPARHVRFLLDLHSTAAYLHPSIASKLGIGNPYVQRLCTCRNVAYRVCSRSLEQASVLTRCTCDGEHALVRARGEAGA